jgi:hypothetical protein
MNKIRIIKKINPIPGVYIFTKNFFKKFPSIFSRKTNILYKIQMEREIGMIKINPEIKYFFNVFIFFTSIEFEKVI